jgi:hypothetical protein
MKKIDEEAYKAGAAAFQKGKSLRWLMEQRLASQASPPYAENDWQAAETKQQSLELGFADAVLNKLRNLR